MTRELYVYWHLAAGHVSQAAAAMDHWHAELAARHAGLQVRLLRRADSGGEGAALSTLMEIYVCAEGIGPALQAEIEAEGAQAAARWCQGVRHVEVFEPNVR